mgnify:CR=1 FL=1
MKRTILLITLPLIVFACSKQTQYDISGNIKNMNKVPVTLQKTQDGEWSTVDSAQVEFGEFSFQGKLKHPQMMRLVVGQNQGKIKFFAENADISIKAKKDSLSSAQVKGSQVHRKYKDFQGQLKDFNHKLEKARQAYQKAHKKEDEKAMEQAGKRYRKISEDRRAFVKEYVGKNGDSYLAPYLTRKYLLPYMEYPELDSIYKTFATKVKQTSYGKALNERRNTLERTQVGKKFIDFTLPDTSGTPVSFSDHVGDGYVLLDFWAAWCGPCRRENPNLVDAYQKYHDKGFEIFGVSFDKSKKAWLKAIDKDNITWPQVSDLEYWDNKAGEKYGIRSIPSNFLIDEDGKIVEKNLRGEELDKKLQEIYGEES